MIISTASSWWHVYLAWETKQYSQLRELMQETNLLSLTQRIISSVQGSIKWHPKQEADRHALLCADSVSSRTSHPTISNSRFPSSMTCPLFLKTRASLVVFQTLEFSNILERDGPAAFHNSLGADAQTWYFFRYYFLGWVVGLSVGPASAVPSPVVKQPSPTLHRTTSSSSLDPSPGRASLPLSNCSSPFWLCHSFSSFKFLWTELDCWYVLWTLCKSPYSLQGDSLAYLLLPLVPKPCWIDWSTAHPCGLSLCIYSAKENC